MKSFKNPWSEELTFQVVTGGNERTIIDFNRYNYLYFPSTSTIKTGKVTPVARSLNAKDIFFAFKHSEYSSVSKHTFFTYLRKYIIFCDNNNLNLFTEGSVHKYGFFQVRRTLKGEIKNSTFTTLISETKGLFLLLGFSGRWFETLPTLGRNQTESWKAYSDKDLRKLLPLLRSFFKQTAQWFLETPDALTLSLRIRAPARFRWKGITYPVDSVVCKLIACAVYLLSYYTWANNSVLLSLQRPQGPQANTDANWYQMSAFKRRAFRIVTVEIGDHAQLNIPRYSMEFFNTLLKVSTKLSPEPGSLLFQVYNENGLSPVSASHLRAFNLYIDDYFHLVDDKNCRLSPIISRFRATGSQVAQVHHSHMHAARLLGNTPSTVRRHYSEGNEFENNAMMQDALLIFADMAEKGISVDTAKERQKDKLNIPVLTYEKMLKLHNRPMQQAHGSYCSNPYGVQAQKFHYRAERHNLLSSEKYTCSDLMGCFSCPHQVIIAEPADIWCLLSFKECIEESIYRHVDKTHFNKNYSGVLDTIEKILITIDKRVLKKAERKLAEEGPHPLWQEYTQLYPSAKGRSHETE
ncbi:hypothetical protein JW310_19470 [Enterobacter cloacae subsp. cloacae]|uniref:hypothetical protein n=1 Tax=Enterobacter cloacae TaxID=550 RepID=UPI001C5B1E29|nr:hypothetical protein [Enterobacter cloacae]ELG9999712.1 hypothetical protein [Enterobacter cloacae]MBW4198819.1 hypothetical protein [Enterobacter cloacae subsp. cloacae]